VRVIGTHGFTSPVIANARNPIVDSSASFKGKEAQTTQKTKYKIINGQCRRDAAMLIPLAAIPVILVDLDDVHATQLGLAMDARYGHTTMRCCLD
jgi:ParB-like chromosome segregation protein Spo0J